MTTYPPFFNRHDITEIMLKVTLNTTTLTPPPFFVFRAKDRLIMEIVLLTWRKKA